MKSVQKRSVINLLILTLMIGLLVPTVKGEGGSGDEREELVPNDTSEDTEEDENDVEIESEDSAIDDDLNMPDSDEEGEEDDEVIIHKGRERRSLI